jgi:hypothetical protein
MSNKLMILGVFLICASVPAVADRAADEAAIRESTKQFNAAVNRNDTKAIEALLDENLEKWTGDLKGPAALVRAIKDNPDMAVRFLEEVGIVFLTPDIAQVYGLEKVVPDWNKSTGKRFIINFR